MTERRRAILEPVDDEDDGDDPRRGLRPINSAVNPGKEVC
jgi:hypothetical protein